MWLFAQAQASFENVRQICDQIIDKPIPKESPLYLPLVVSMYVLYARLFSKSKGIARLSEKLVPKKFRDLHRQMISMRNEVIAHSDAKPSIELNGLLANNVRAFVSPDRFDLGVYVIKPEPDHVKESRQLAIELSEIMVRKISDLHDKHRPQIPSSPGEYTLNVESGSFDPVDPVLID